MIVLLWIWWEYCIWYFWQSIQLLFTAVTCIWLKYCQYEAVMFRIPYSLKKINKYFIYEKWWHAFTFLQNTSSNSLHPALRTYMSPKSTFTQYVSVMYMRMWHVYLEWFMWWTVLGFLLNDVGGGGVLRNDHDHFLNKSQLICNLFFNNQSVWLSYEYNVLNNMCIVMTSMKQLVGL